MGGSAMMMSYGMIDFDKENNSKENFGYMILMKEWLMLVFMMKTF